ncbi:MAG: serine/threonine-protein phosphatase [Kofleriaceae bacterium]|nr:serine/threonine-protein phosphatase [Kofleriaceae bacterium]MBP6835697.1 serine/threonine-protein phosphatase [Kofleriaceae bacterium]MBP9204974.1 serine/threonine-protein phosphatase [Kofleriaceae bacterium]
MKVRAAGETNVGLVRAKNEDTIVVDPRRGLYAVFDGMGGVAGGDVAAQAARDRLIEVVQEPPAGLGGRALLEQAIQAACGHVHALASANRERQGMGTTVVACLVEDGKVIIGHVGDSRAYLLRDGRLMQMTRDHTIIAELVERGVITAEDGERHAYKNVLSRNLGARPEAKIDFAEVELRGGDRLLLCSDGLYGFATVEAVQYLLGSGDPPDQVARDLVELALRGGGGDNVSTIVLEATAPAPTTTQVVRTRGATAWWQRRARFLAAAKERGVGASPIAASLPPGERVELIAGSLAQAIFHDLEKSTGVNVWTYAHNLAVGWLGRGGEWGPLRALIDHLVAAARVVMDELRTEDPALLDLLDTALTRALVVAELAIGSVLDEQLRALDAELVALHAAHPAHGDAAGSDESARFLDQPTIPFMGRRARTDDGGLSAELQAAVRGAVRSARSGAGGLPLVEHVLSTIEAIATEAGGEAVAELGARDLYGVRTIDEAGVAPLFDALERARLLVVTGVHRLAAAPAVKAGVLRRVGAAHQRLAGTVAALVVEAAEPAADRLRREQTKTAELRREALRVERRLAELELRSATGLDGPSPSVDDPLGDGLGDSPWDLANTTIEGGS